MRPIEDETLNVTIGGTLTNQSVNGILQEWGSLILEVSKFLWDSSEKGVFGLRRALLEL